MKLNARCQSTGIGSLPYKDLDKALEVVFRNCDIPFWPQLPRVNPRERMIPQFSQMLPGLNIVGDSLKFNEKNRDQQLEKFYEKIISKDVEYFGISDDYAIGFYKFLELLKQGKIKKDLVKGHITGPFTFAGGIKKEDGKDLIGDPVMMEAIVQFLAFKALWQVRKFGQFGKKAIIFIDEPFLSCFGSAYTPINESDVVNNLSTLIGLVKSQEDCLIGFHCCGNTDWGIFLNLDIDIINFDAYGFLDRFLLYSGDIKKFIERDKTIAWGIVPTSEFDKQKINLDYLIEKFNNQAVNTLINKGLERKIILEHALITPSCGLGSIDISKDKTIAEDIFLLTKQIADHFKKELG